MKSTSLAVLVGFTCAVPAFAQEMATSPEEDPTRNYLSTLWTTVAINMVAADVLSSFIPGAQEDLEETVGGKGNVKYAMLAGAAIYQVPVSMIFLSRYLSRDANRWTNFGAATLATALVIGGGSTHPHYLFIASVETLTLAYIAWTAWKWPEPGNGRPAGTAPFEEPAIGIFYNPGTSRGGFRYSFAF